LLATVALAAFVAAMVVIAIASTGSNKTTVTAAPTTTVRAATTTRPVEVTTVRMRTAIPLHLDPTGVYDPPPGDGRENDSQVPNAVDGDPATSWSTEHYKRGFTKDGVGIVLDVSTGA
jgi:hypothetical protein